MPEEDVMRRFIILLPVMLWSVQPVLACSSAELTDKIRMFGEATKAAFARDPGGDEARKAQVMTITGRYSGLKPGPGVIDAICRQYDELLAVYR
jgi:hypothetical protein